MTFAEARTITVPMRKSAFWRMTLDEVGANDAGLEWMSHVRDKNICKSFIFQHALVAYLTHPPIVARLAKLGD